MSSLFNLPWQQVFDSSGNTLAGAKLYFYIAGTSTPKNVYSDIGLGVALSNPVVANGAGRFPPIYMDNEAYKVVLKNEKDELIWTADNVYAQSIDADAAFALAAIKGLTVSAGYTQEQAEEIANFARAVYKYANASTWYSETGNEDNKYILEGFDDYTRPIDYFTGMQVWFYTTRANTGAATVNIASLGTKNICHADGSTLFAEDIYGLVHLIYNGSSFVIENNRMSAYPVGSIYATRTDTNPRDILGFGTWELITSSVVSGESNPTVYGNGSLRFNYQDTGGREHNDGTVIGADDNTRDGPSWGSVRIGTTTNDTTVGKVVNNQSNVKHYSTVGLAKKAEGSVTGVYADTEPLSKTIYIWERTA